MLGDVLFILVIAAMAGLVLGIPAAVFSRLFRRYRIVARLSPLTDAERISIGVATALAVALLFFLAGSLLARFR